MTQSSPPPSPNDETLLRELVRTLGAVPGIRAIALGGSLVLALVLHLLVEKPIMNLSHAVLPRPRAQAEVFEMAARDGKMVVRGGAEREETYVLNEEVLAEECDDFGSDESSPT